MGGDHNALMTTLFAENYLHEIPFDIQLDIMNYSKSQWRINIDHFDKDDWYNYFRFDHDMIRKDMNVNDEVAHNTIHTLNVNLLRSYTTYQFANQKLSEAINELLKYQNDYDFDLYDLFKKIKLKEDDTFPSLYAMRRIYDWNKQDYIDNPNYVPNKDYEYSSDEDEDE